MYALNGGGSYRTIICVSVAVYKIGTLTCSVSEHRTTCVESIPRETPFNVAFG
jgi:hypothetical protein